MTQAPGRPAHRRVLLYSPALASALALVLYLLGVYAFYHTSSLDTGRLLGLPTLAAMAWLCLSGVLGPLLILGGLVWRRPPHDLLWSGLLTLGIAGLFLLFADAGWFLTV